MKAAIIDKPGNLEEVLEIQEIQLPEPKEGQVRIKVHAANINPSDIMFAQSLYGIRPKYPSGVGFEGAGIIDKVGANTTIKVGTRVSFTTIGSWAEYAIADAHTLIILPDEIPDEIGCQLFVNPYTAFALLNEANLKEGDFLLLTAGGSTFSQLIIQIAAKKGIKTICTVRSNVQLKQLKQLGAYEVINVEQESLLERVMHITEKKGIPVCMDAVGGKLITDILPCVAKNGRLLVYGMLSLQESLIHNGLMIFKNLKVEGFWLTTWMMYTDPKIVKAIAQEVIKAFATNTLKLHIEKKYLLDEVKQAVSHADSSGRKGKILITLPKINIISSSYQ